MKSLPAKLFIIALSVLLIVTPTLAEVIYLKDGTRIEGRIERITDKNEVVIHVTSARVGTSFERVPMKWIDYVRVNAWTDISPDSLESILARSEGRSLEEMFAGRPETPRHESSGMAEGETQPVQASYAEGLQQGRNAASRHYSSGGWFGGGVACGLLGGLIGTGILAAASQGGTANPPASELVRIQQQDCQFQAGFMRGYDRKANAKALGASVYGGLLGTAVIVTVYLLVTAGSE